MKPEQKRTAEGILYTDMYQLTMAQLYFRAGMHEQEVQFDYFFRTYPDYGSHKAGYCVYAGMQDLVEWMEGARFRERDISLLRKQKGKTGSRLFDDDFLEWLEENGDFSGISIRAVPEGRLVHPQVPAAVIRGPFAAAQILESSLLNRLNYQTLTATRAARIHCAARGNTVLEFGLRRGQDTGANGGARGALIGGADFTSNTGLSCALGFPPKGTHAHSMVQAFLALGRSELDAFEAYADVYPDDCLLLVDTIDTLESGVPNAVRVFKKLRSSGHTPAGIRLDSGDLAYLAIRSADMLNSEGFEDISIVLSNQLDELVIWQILTQIEHEAEKYGVDPDHLIGRLVYGVGTRLITSEGHAALDGVYKLTAVHKNGEWLPAVKLSETPEKTVNPGDKGVWRIYGNNGKAAADLIALRDEKPAEESDLLLHHPSEHGTSRIIEQDDISSAEALQTDIMRSGRTVYDFPPIREIRGMREKDIERLDEGVKRLINPHFYHVSLSRKLWNLKQDIIREYAV